LTFTGTHRVHIRIEIGRCSTAINCSSPVNTGLSAIANEYKLALDHPPEADDQHRSLRDDFQAITVDEVLEVAAVQRHERHVEG